ncbi:hypothetical protein GH714_035769 [Hevea brasiliensis]|uniref:Cation/H+ exchanger domain-containing protein n=1 Tax=Hevea brasiliensis TaxID=3981 RepID=A0A6A6KFT5_HEVBR|nr:hypothetical protein GH714_035769 [Hevea brasiliensis]
MSTALIIGFVLFITFVLRPLMYWVIKQTPEGRPVHGLFTYTILLVTFISALITNALGRTPIRGAVLIGSAIPDGPPLGSAFIDKFDGFLSNVLLPFFVSTVVMKEDVGDISEKLDWDKMLDSEALKDVKPNVNVHKLVRYIEEEVQDEGHTASLIRSMKNDSDLRIVERLHGINSSQTSGLNEWSEFPALGDLLASREMNYKNSVLVVQQQISQHQLFSFRKIFL